MSPAPHRHFLDRTTPPHIVTLVILSGLAAAAMNLHLPSLPSMAAYFGTPYSTMQLTVSLYLAASVLLQLAIGPLSDRFGRRPVMLGALGLFALFTLGTLVTHNVVLFLMCRMGQAAIVSGHVLSRAIVRDMYDENKAASMIGYVTMGMAIVPMIAPLIGGILDETFGWRASFWVLLAAGLAVMALTWADQGETAAPRTGPGHSLWHQAPDLLRAPRFWGYSLTMTFASGAFFSYLGGAPFVGVQVFGLSPSVLGFFFGAPAAGYFVGNAISGAFSIRLGVNRMVLIGTLLTSAGLTLSLVLFLIGAGTVWSFFGLMTTVGLGNGMVLPNATSGMMSVRPHLAGTASGLGGAMMLGGGASLSALAGVLLTPGAGALPLVWMMLLTSLASVACMGVVLLRERQLSRRMS